MQKLGSGSLVDLGPGYARMSLASRSRTGIAARLTCDPLAMGLPTMTSHHQGGVRVALSLGRKP